MGAKKKILVLDDEGCIRDLIDEVLQDAGYEVITAESPGMAAVRAYKADLVVLDLSMTEKDDTEGMNVLVHLWEDKLNHTPVIIFSEFALLPETQNEIREMEEVYGDGRKVYDCIPKSDGMAKLVESVDRLFGNVREEAY